MPDPTPAARALAARLAAGAWQLDADPDAVPADDVAGEVEPVPVPPPLPGRTQSRLFPRAVAASVAPPPMDRLVEALLFAGGPPVTADLAEQTVRGLTPDRFRGTVDDLNRRYRDQNRPYAIDARAGGYVLAVRPAYLRVHAKLAAGPREARLTQAALDVLSVVAYRQPATKADVDAVRGADSAGPLRQLVRLGLVALSRPEPNTPPAYTTTKRFLELLRLDALADLPKLGESRAVP